MLSEDLQTIERVRSGDSAAFAQLVERHQRRLLGLLANACGEAELAEDIAQEAFARAYQKLALFSGESQFYTWLAYRNESAIQRSPPQTLGESSQPRRT